MTASLPMPAATERSAAQGPTIALSITHGFQARMLLRSAIADTLLANGVQLVVLSHNSGEDYFRREFSHPQITLEEMPARFSRIEANLINLRQFLLMHPSLGATLNYKNEAFRRASPTRYWATRAANSVLGRVTPLRRGYLKAEGTLFPGKEFDELLARYRPQLVVTGTPGYNRDDIHLLRAARRAGIPTATVMLSWDNLTSKGYMGAVPDHLLVWSQLMADEAVTHHEFPARQIHWVGAAQFDHYHGVRDRLDRQAWRRRHGVPEDRPLIVYGTINPAILPHEAQLLRGIVDAVRQGRFARKPHIWVRLHPQVVRGYYSQSLAPFRELAGPDVTVEEPPVQSDKLAWDLPREDATHLAELLAAADVVVTPSSTLVIDAACAGTPVVNVLFDGADNIPPERSALRFAHYTHYAKILATGGIAQAHSIDEFVRMVDDYVASPERDAQARAGMIEQQLGRLDGQSGRRTAEKLLELCSRAATGAPLAH